MKLVKFISIAINQRGDIQNRTNVSLVDQTWPVEVLSKAMFTRMYGLETDMQPSQDAPFTWGTRPGMGSVGTRPWNLRLKPGRSCDRHGTVLECLYVNRRVHASVMYGK